MLAPVTCDGFVDAIVIDAAPASKCYRLFVMTQTR
jgi:hypothetical protein